MKLSKAIEILKEHVAWCDPVKEVDTYQALKLGIEAGKRLQQYRLDGEEMRFTPLPGETKE